MHHFEQQHIGRESHHIRIPLKKQRGKPPRRSLRFCTPDLCITLVHKTACDLVAVSTCDDVVRRDFQNIGEQCDRVLGPIALHLALGCAEKLSRLYRKQCFGSSLVRGVCRANETEGLHARDPESFFDHPHAPR